MKRFRMAFLACALLIAVMAFLWLHHPDFSPRHPMESGLPASRGFQVTGISEKGNLFLNNDESQLADIRTSVFSGETRLRSDDQTAWEFYFEGVLFSVLPRGGIRYTSQTRELILENGEFYWSRKSGRPNIEIALLKAGNVVRLSASGRIRLIDRVLEIWNYSGQLDLDFNGRPFHMQELQYLKIIGGVRFASAALFPPPASISPESDTITLSSANDAVLQFKWKNVRGAGSYLLKLYPSPWRDSVLASKVVAGNSILLDILPYIDYDELYWEVAAFDEARDIESVPARMGLIKIGSSLLKKGLTAQPPRLEVSSLSVSGNMVLIKGGTDANAQLSIEGVAIKLDSDGKFIHTISYRSIGVKSIVFRAVAPSGLETVIKKQVTIFEE